MRILITGVTGFIGRHLAARLAEEHQVIGLARRRPPTPIPGVTYLYQELTAPLDLAQLPPQIDAVIHQAAQIHIPATFSGGADDAAPFLANVVATWRLLRYAEQAGAQRFVHASTGGVYGCRNQPFVESDPLNPLDLYSLTKSQAELVVRHTPTPFPTVILRYFFPYGLGTPNPIPDYLRQALHGVPIAVPSSRKPNFNPIHIDDTVTATVAALALDEDATINVAGTEITNFAALAEMAAARAGRTAHFTLQPDDDVIAYYRADLVADITQMHRRLGFTPQVSLTEGIAQLADDLRAGERDEPQPG
jgi:nucleoside-diphosphate-sugar epimerase